MAANRRLPGARFHVTVLPALDFVPSGDDARDIQALTAAIHRPDRGDGARQSRPMVVDSQSLAYGARHCLDAGPIMTTRQRILDQLFFGRDPLKDFPAGRFPTDLQGWHSQHPYLTRAMDEVHPTMCGGSGSVERRFGCHHGQGDSAAEAGRSCDRHRHLARLQRNIISGRNSFPTWISNSAIPGSITSLPPISATRVCRSMSCRCRWIRSTAFNC